MIRPIDVKSIDAIPEITKYLDNIFDLVLYERGDNLQIYEYHLTTELYISLEIHSEEQLIEAKDKLINLITQEETSFLQITTRRGPDGEDVVSSYWYRPLVEDKDKTFK